jgi:siroheme synthase
LAHECTALQGTRPRQATVFATVATLPDRIEEMNRPAPTLLVIGRVVALTETLAWFRP